MSRVTRPERTAEAGFTLLEVLVALALLAAAMASLGSLSSVGRRANRVEAERVELAQVARRLVNELTERNFARGSAGAMDGYAWRIDVEPMAVDSPNGLFGLVPPLEHGQNACVAQLSKAVPAETEFKPHLAGGEARRAQ